jgi:hypothetical protein
MSRKNLTKNLKRVGGFSRESKADRGVSNTSKSRSYQDLRIEINSSSRKEEMVKHL